MDINKDTLQDMLNSQDMPNCIQLPEVNATSLMKGKVSFETLPSGLRLHCSDVVEKENSMSSAEIAPCLSLNILLAGKVSFGLGSHDYEFSDHQRGARLFVNVLHQTEIFTRHVIKDQRVKKVNICCDKPWLFRRSQTSHDMQRIETLFNAGTKVYEFECPNEMIDSAESLLLLDTDKALESQLEIERLTLKILTWCLPKLFEQQADITPAVVKTMNIQRQDQQLYLLFDSLVMQSLSLSEMAIKLGLSVSTLQRKIKDRYAMTAVEYVRQKKLEKAKSSLVLDNLSIGEIAYIAGYAHVSNFVTAFKKKFELTPAQFRTIHTSYRVR